MDHQALWVISLVIFLTLMGVIAIIGGILIAKIMTFYIYGDNEEK